jgi:hypothetical protein
MPNWCYNTATLTASKEQIDALEQELQKKEDANPFQHLRPSSSRPRRKLV